MQTKAMKRTVVALAAAFFAVSTGAFAEARKPVALSDAQLDQVTAGGAITVKAVFNAGKAHVEHSNMRHVTCINCETVSHTGSTATALTVIKPNDKGMVIRSRGF